MRGTKLLSIAVGASITAGLLAPAVADEFTDSLASMRRAMVGHWSGKISGTDGSGNEFDVDDDFTFVVTSEDGLDSATWSSETLEIATYETDGRYRVRWWNRTGGQGGVEYRLRIVEGPDEQGNGAWVQELEQTGPEGTVMGAREHFRLSGDALRMEIEVRPAGSEEPFETTVVGNWSRVSN
ncbi:MAG TPA: hypothetical protein VF339_10415 [Gammaproteobacteria bacterium]